MGIICVKDSGPAIGDPKKTQKWTEQAVVYGSKHEHAAKLYQIHYPWFDWGKGLFFSPCEELFWCHS